jgi:hypothetical protein
MAHHRGAQDHNRHIGRSRPNSECGSSGRRNKGFLGTRTRNHCRNEAGVLPLRTEKYWSAWVRFGHGAAICDFALLSRGYDQYAFAALSEIPTSPELKGIPWLSVP